MKHLLFTLQVAEKIVLPSAEDLKNEKVHENLQKGIEGFTPDKLKAVKTKEPASGADRKKTFSCIVINVYTMAYGDIDLIIHFILQFK